MEMPVPPPSDRSPPSAPAPSRNLSADIRQSPPNRSPEPAHIPQVDGSNFRSGPTAESLPTLQDVPLPVPSSPSIPQMNPSAAVLSTDAERLLEEVITGQVVPKARVEGRGYDSAHAWQNRGYRIPDGSHAGESSRRRGEARTAESNEGSDPVLPGSGEFVFSRTDLSLPGVGMDFQLRRVYHSLSSYRGPLGANWTHSYDQWIEVEVAVDCGLRSVLWHRGDGRRSLFDEHSQGQFRSQQGSSDQLQELTNGDLSVQIATGETYLFARLHEHGEFVLQSITDLDGNLISLGWQTIPGAARARLVLVVDTLSRNINFIYDGNGFVDQVEVQGMGLTIDYKVDFRGDLVRVTSPEGLYESYVYETQLGPVRPPIPGQIANSSPGYAPYEAVDSSCRTHCEGPAVCGGRGGACGALAAAESSDCQAQCLDTNLCKSNCTLGCEAACAVHPDILDPADACESDNRNYCLQNAVDLCIDTFDSRLVASAQARCTSTARTACEDTIWCEFKAHTRYKAWCQGSACGAGAADAFIGSGGKVSFNEAEHLRQDDVYGNRHRGRWFCKLTDKGHCYDCVTKGEKCPDGNTCLPASNGCFAQVREAWIYGPLAANQCTAALDGGCVPTVIDRCGGDWSGICNTARLDACNQSCGSDCGDSCSPTALAASCPRVCDPRPMRAACAPDCYDSCIAANIPSDGTRVYGDPADLPHNLLLVIDGSDKVYITNTYGRDISAPDYDKVIVQDFGGLVINYAYADLEDPKNPRMGPVARMSLEPALDSEIVSVELCPETCDEGVGEPAEGDRLWRRMAGDNYLVLRVDSGETADPMDGLAGWPVTGPQTLQAYDWYELTVTKAGASIVPAVPLLGQVLRLETRFGDLILEASGNGTLSVAGLASDSLDRLAPTGHVSLIRVADGQFEAIAGRVMASAQVSGACADRFIEQGQPAAVASGPRGAVALYPSDSCTGRVRIHTTGIRGGDGQDFEPLEANRGLLSARSVIEWSTARGLAVPGQSYSLLNDPYELTGPNNLACQRPPVMGASPVVCETGVALFSGGFAIAPDCSKPFAERGFSAGLELVCPAIALRNSPMPPACEPVYGAPIQSVGVDANQPIANATLVTSEGRSWLYYADTNGRVLRTVDLASGRRTDLNFDALGRRIGSQAEDGQRMCIKHNAQGLPVRGTSLPQPGVFTAQPAIWKAFAWSAWQRLHAVSGVNANVALVTHYYDAKARVRTTASLDGDRVTSYIYDSRGRVDEMTSWLGAPGSASAVSVVTKFIPDPQGGWSRRIDDLGGSEQTTTTLHRDAFARVTSVDSAVRPDQDFTYDRDGRLLTVTTEDATGLGSLLTTYVYDASGELAEIIAPETTLRLSRNLRGEVVSKTHFDNSDPTAARDECLHIDGRGQLLARIDAEGRSTVLVRDALGQLIEVHKGIDLALLSQAWSLSCAGNLRDAAAPGMERVVRWTREPADGRVRWQTLGEYVGGEVPWQSAFVYDGFARVVEQRASDDAAVRLGYDAAGRVLWRATYAPGLPPYPAGLMADGSPDLDDTQLRGFVRHTYDQWGRSTASQQLWFVLDDAGVRTPLTQPGSPDGWLRATTHYDLRNQRITSTNSEGSVSWVQTDRFGRPKTVSHADGTYQDGYVYIDHGRVVVRTTSPAPTPTQQLVSRSEYSKHGLLERSCADGTCQEVLQTTEYDALGRPLRRTAGGTTLQMNYNSFGELTNTSRVDSTGALHPYLAYGYNRNGLRISSEDANGNQSAVAYDGLNRVSRRDSSVGLEVYGYRAGTGTPLHVDRPSGAIDRLSYDAHGRLTSWQSSYSNAPVGWQTTTLTRVYDSLGLRITYASNRSDRTDDDVTHTYHDRNSLGLAQRVEVRGPVIETVSLGYSGQGQLKSLQAGGPLLSFTNDALGRLEQVQVSGQPFADWSYAGAGGARIVQWGNGLQSNKTYDDQGRPVGTEVLDLATGLRVGAQWPYWGPDQQVHRIDRQTAGRPMVTTLFGSDDLGRLVTAEAGLQGLPGMQAGGVGTAAVQPYFSPAATTYQLDDADNRERLGVGNATAKYSLGAGNRLVAVADQPFTHAVGGSVLSTPNTASYGYDGFGRLVQATTAAGVDYEFAYDADGNLAESRWGSDFEATVFLGGRLLQRQSSTATEYYVPGPGLSAIGVETNGDLLTLHAGWGERLSWVSDQTGQLLEEIEYSPYGAPTYLDGYGAVQPQSITGRKALLTGRMYFDDLELYALSARWYAPEFGRFLSPDPLGLADGPNRYAYVGGQPVMFADPFGLRRSSARRAADRAYQGYHRAKRIADRAHRVRTGRYPFEDLDKFYTLGLAGLVTAPLIGGTGLGASGTAGAYAGLSTGLGLSVTLAAPPVLLAAGLSGGAKAMDQAMIPLTLAASPGTLVGGVIGMTLADDPRSGMLMGSGIGAGVEGLANLVGMGWRALARGRCAGGACLKGTCFVAGTAVAVTGPEEALPIEAIRVGDRVRTVPGGSETNVDGTWRTIHLELPNPRSPRDVVDIVLLRSPEWLQAHGVKAQGARVFLDLEEVSVEGWAQVTAIRPAPHVTPGFGRVVLATVTHINSDVRSLAFVDAEAPLEVTGQHKLYSLDRDDWVRVWYLQVGERLQTAEGAVTIAALERVRGHRQVFNLEVEGDHEFLVGDSGVRAHNTDCFDLEPHHLGHSWTGNTIGKIIVKGDKFIVNIDWIGNKGGTVINGTAIESLKNLAREYGAKALRINTTRIVERTGRLSPILQKRYGFQKMGGERLFLEVEL